MVCQSTRTPVQTNKQTLHFIKNIEKNFPSRLFLPFFWWCFLKQKKNQPHELGFTLRFAQKKAPQIRWRSRSFLNKFNEFSVFSLDPISFQTEIKENPPVIKRLLCFFTLLLFSKQWSFKRKAVLACWLFDLGFGLIGRLGFHRTTPQISWQSPSFLDKFNKFSVSSFSNRSYNKAFHKRRY